MKQDEALDPLDVSVFDADAEMADADRLPHAVEERRGIFGCLHGHPPDGLVFYMGYPFSSTYPNM